MIYLFTIVLIITSVKTYSIQGNWSLISSLSIQQNNQQIILGITDFVYQQSQILQKLTFYGCEQMLLQSQFSQNQLFINFKSLLIQPIQNLVCGQSNISNQIQQALNTVFFFEINLDKLIFNDPYGQNVMVFQRLISNVSKNITGIWNLNQYSNTMTSLSVQISNTQITLCQGNLIYNYTLQPAQNSIKLISVLATCPSQGLISAFSASKYYHINNGILEFYDNSIAITASMVYTSAFDPNKPIFTVTPPAPAPTPTPTPITTSIPTSVPPSNSVPVSAASTNNIPQNMPISTSNLVGQWNIISLFKISLPSTPYSISFTDSILKLNGGCNTYTYPYSLNSNAQIITLGNSIATTNSCGQSDDQLYVNGINKMYKYLLTNIGNTHNLNFYDQTGNIGFSLQNKDTQSQPSSLVTAQASLPLSSGTYLLLLLQRRDLPRLIVTILGNTISYKSCNSVTQTFSPTQLSASSSKISITGGPTTSNTCAVNNDAIYYSTLNKASSYTYDANAGATIFSSPDGAQIATLSRS